MKVESVATSNLLRTRKDDVFSLMRCAWLFEQRGFSFLPESRIHERVPDKGTHPDYFVEVPGVGPLLVEVESFVQVIERFQSPGKFAQINLQAPIRRMRTATKGAAAQLKPYAELEIPLVVILDNHRLCGIPSDIEFLRDAAFGQTEFRAPWDPIRGQLGEMRIHHGSKQVLSESRKTYISAVFWNIPKVAYAYNDDDEEVPMRVCGLLNHFAGVPFPLEIFTDTDDRIFGYGADGRWRRQEHVGKDGHCQH